MEYLGIPIVEYQKYQGTNKVTCTERVTIVIRDRRLWTSKNPERCRKCTENVVMWK